MATATKVATAAVLVSLKLEQNISYLTAISLLVFVYKYFYESFWFIIWCRKNILYKIKKKLKLKIIIFSIKYNKRLIYRKQRECEQND